MIALTFHFRNTAQCWGGVVDGEFWFPGMEQEIFKNNNLNTIHLANVQKLNIITMEKEIKWSREIETWIGIKILQKPYHSIIDRKGLVSMSLKTNLSTVFKHEWIVQTE